MKLAQLKEKVYETWEFLNECKSCVIQPENFKPEVRQFGDLRRKATWVKALAQFEALSAYYNCLDAYMLILNIFNFTEDRWDYAYRHEIFDAFLGIPEGLDLIKLGLEQLFSAPFNDRDRSEAHGFFELVSEQQTRRGLPTRSVWELTGISAA